MIRPLEYRYFDAPDDIYNEEHTYLKGAAVLHMLRAVLGDEAFFGALGDYLDLHQLGNVVSNDLLIAIEESTGRNLDWFFADWVTGGGHPIFEVAYRYRAERGMVDLEIAQVQPLVDGQGLFRLPVTIAVATADGIREETVWVEKATEKVLLPAAEKPLMVSFDGGGDLVAEIRFDKDPDELAYQARNDGLPGRMRALGQLARRFPTRPETLEVFGEILAGDGFWALRAEAAELLGEIRTQAAARPRTTGCGRPRSSPGRASARRRRSGCGGSSRRIRPPTWWGPRSSPWRRPTRRSTGRSSRRSWSGSRGTTRSGSPSCGR